MNNLRDRETRASLLSFFMIAVTRGLNYVTSFVLLFLLTPLDFGVMAMVMSVIAIINSITAFGFDSALISLKDDEGPYLNDAWTLELIKAVALAGALALSAGYIASFLGHPILEGPLTVMSLVFILQSAKNIGLASLRKKLEFGSIFWCEAGMALVQCILTVTIAYKLPSVWALVVGYLGGWSAYLVLSFVLCAYRPALSFNVSNVAELLSYSRWILGSGQINSVVENGVNIFAGNFFGLTVVGQLERADMFTRKTAAQIGEVVWKVGLPSLSARSGDASSLSNRYFSFYRFVCWLAIPAMVLVCAYIPVVVGSQGPDSWRNFSSFIIILSCAAILQSFTIPANVLFQAVRRPQLGMKVASIKLLGMVSCLPPAIFFLEILGVGYAILLVAFLICLLSIREVNRIIQTSFAQHVAIAVEYSIPCAVFLLLNPGGKPLTLEIAHFMLSVIAYLAILLISSRTSRVTFKRILEVISHMIARRNIDVP